MRVFPVVSALLATLAIACGATPDQQADHQAEWRTVLRHKEAAANPNASTQHKQVYADSVRAFVQKHPNHGRAREVWQRIQLEFASDLAAVGRNHDSIRFYRAVLTHDPTNEAARRGLATAVERLAVSRDKLQLLEKGMTQRQVSGVLGKPMPGWSARTDRSEARFEAWYYRTRSGSVAAVYFRDGRVLAAEEASNARFASLRSH
ncbi:MAG TPA: hypothetical protein VHW00_22735 [Thermoanaerobaculia bacterium]|nr:hypothetical protein [Thermoanaerobaculia bacterium]